jgi:DNA (cytosine-5)-methyltransferase 1
VTRPPTLRASFLRDDELVVDSFAGGGGASTGIEAALGRPVDLAINHSPEAIAVHKANHPATRHHCQNVWEVDPVDACGGRPVGLAWFSPDCTHFSRAKGGKPRSKKVRSLAWVVTRWAKAVAPRVIVLENVEEFQTWGPLAEDGRPCPRRAGKTFRAWLSKLRGYGYRVEFRLLTAADYGAPTTRRRLFLVARRDEQPIAWPAPTHGKGRTPWRAASEVIDWSLPCPSIFGRAKPLAEATLRRIAAGVRRYVLESAEPFLVKYHGGAEWRGQSVAEPLRTVDTANRFALVTAFLTKHYGGVVGHGVQRPLGTITCVDHHAVTTATLAPAGADRAESVSAFLVKYYGADGRDSQQSLFAPLHTITTKARFGLVTVKGEPYQITDIGMRMLTPRELFAAQSFPSSYVIAPEFRGKPLSKTAQTELAGNSVCPVVAEAIVSAQLGERAAREVA